MPQVNPTAILKYISRESFTLGTGVASIAINPPANATHMIFGRGTLGAGEAITYRVTVDGVPQDFFVNSSATTIVGIIVMPICTDATVHTFLRSVTTAGDSYTVFYLGPR